MCNYTAESLPVIAKQVQIIAQTTSSQNCGQEGSLTPVNLLPFGDVIKLSFVDSSKYAGILALPILCKLKNELTIDYTATMALLDSKNDRGVVAGKT